MQTGIDSFAAAISDPATGLTLSPAERMHHLLEEIELADKVGLDVFGIGEHHRAEFLDSAPVVILSAAATRTENIRLTSAVTVLSASDPVKLSPVAVRSLSRIPSSGCVLKIMIHSLRKKSSFS
jgi:hypothetical protein